MTEQRISWMTLTRGTPITASDGDEIGKVNEVVADSQKDIFSGVTFKDGLLGNERFVPAELIEDMTEEHIRLNIPATEAAARLEPYEG